MMTLDIMATVIVQVSTLHDAEYPITQKVVGIGGGTTIQFAGKFPSMCRLRARAYLCIATTIAIEIARL